MFYIEQPVTQKPNIGIIKYFFFTMKTYIFFFILLTLNKLSLTSRVIQYLAKYMMDSTLNNSEIETVGSLQDQMKERTLR